jgi:hypothetical protein
VWIVKIGRVGNVYASTFGVGKNSFANPEAVFICYIFFFRRVFGGKNALGDVAFPANRKRDFGTSDGLAFFVDDAPCDLYPFCFFGDF